MADSSRRAAKAQPGPAEPPADESRSAAEEQPAADGAQPRTRPSAAGSSPGSSAAASQFFDDAGGFDAEREADAADETAGPEPAVADIVLWTPERVRRLLTLQGNVTHAVAGVAERDWVWLPAELDMVCGPLADYANRVPQLAAMAHLADDAAIAAGFTSYLLRSWRERVRELQRRAEQAAEAGPQSVTGRTPGDDDQPPGDPAWSL